MAPLSSQPEPHAQGSAQSPAPPPSPCHAERFIKVTFERLPARMKVLVALFAAVNSAATLTKGFELSDHLWQAIQFETPGPLLGESEEANWLKGVSDGIRMMSQYS